MCGTEWGVPQGATLAPILLILFPIDEMTSSNKFGLSISADGTCLILRIKHCSYYDTMKSELEKVVNWFNYSYEL